MKDVARVELGAQTYATDFNVDGKPAAGIAVYQTPDANALAVAARSRTRWSELTKAFPPGLAYSVPFDTTAFVRASIDEVFMTLIEAGMLVLIVIVVFLQDWRAMLVPATTIPVTIIGAFAAMAALGFTINLSTLFAIVLAIGIVVDDAIVIVEGVARHIEQGMPGHEAAVKAMQRADGPVIGITLVLMSVFIPAAFLPGLTGQMFAQFALVIAATAFISAINAATLKPTQCAHRGCGPRCRRRSATSSSAASMRGYDRVEHGYARLIGGMVRHAGLMVLLALVLAGIGGWGIARLPTAFIPNEDQGYVLIGVQLPDGASLGRTGTALAGGHARSPRRRRASPGRGDRRHVDARQQAPLANAGVAFVMLEDWGERLENKGQDLRSITESLQRQTASLQDGRTIILVPPPIQGIGNAGGFQMQVEQRDGSFDLAKLQAATDEVIEQARTQPRCQSVHHLPRRRAADRGRRRPLQGRDAERVGGRGVRRAVGLSRLDLRQSVQQVRPEPAGLCPGRCAVSRPARGHPQPQRARVPTARWCRSARWPSSSRRAGRR